MIESGNREVISLLDAIRMVDDAYGNVTTKTIRNCFRKVGIIPQLDREPVIDAPSEVTELTQSIHALNLTNPLTADEYLHIPGEDETGGQDDIAAIVSSLVENEKDDDEEHEEDRKIITREALKACDTLRQYFEQQQTDCATPIAMQKRIRREIESMSSKALVQSAITSFFKPVTENME